MNSAKIRSLLDEANKEINSTLDEAMKARAFPLLRPLTMAQTNLALVEKHLNTFDERVAKAAEDAAAKPAKPAKADKPKK